jgi:glycosyltransferase involved in cell wall biosynthesis
MLDGVFAAVKKRHASVRFRFIGLGRYENSTVEIEGAAWRYDREVEELQGFDIGIMPMPDDEWTRGKLGCKMLQYMSVAIPAVVSYTPTNAEIIEDGVNGFFANTESEWTEKLCRLIEDGSLRAEVGQRGRKTVIDKCSLSANVGRYLDVFKRLSGHD